MHRIPNPPLDLAHGRVDMSHGAGGRAMHQLLQQLFLPALGNPWLLQGDDGDDIEKTWGVDYSKLVPMLIKEIQQLRARVAALESA